MQMYLSGIESTTELHMVEEAAATRILIDRHQYERLLSKMEGIEIALDSGAYRHFKAGTTGDPFEYRAWVQANRERFSYVTALDVVADPDATLSNWLTCFAGNGFMPVWQWGAPAAHLGIYLDGSERVGIGGMVRLLRGGHREKDKTLKKELDQKRAEAIEQLQELCSAYPGRFHIFGICSLDAINQLQGLAASGDTSKWLDGARYGYAIFKHTKTLKLSQAPAGLIPDWGELDRRGRCVRCAAEMFTYGQ